MENIVRMIDDFEQKNNQFIPQFPRVRPLTMVLRGHEFKNDLVHRDIKFGKLIPSGRGTFRIMIDDLHPIRVENQQFFERSKEVPKSRSACPKADVRWLVSRGLI